MKNEYKTIFNNIKLNIDELKGKSVLITGALGMLSANLIDFFKYLNDEQGFNIKCVLLARDEDKLKRRFPSSKYNVEYLVSDMSKELKYEGNLDYILHFAGNSSPYHIKNNPIDIIETNVIGSLKVAKLAKEKLVKKVLYSSTREVYGDVVVSGNKIKENNFGVFDPLDARSCYPESKRMGENVFKSASVQYGVDFNVLRIAHSYGPEMNVSDGRVMADFIGNAIRNEDIELLSDGEALRSFCYVADAVSAIVLVLCKGVASEAYNIANEHEEIKIFDLARKISSLAGDISVTRVEPDKNNAYCAYDRVALCTSKLERLGWNPQFNLNYGLKNTLEHLSNKNEKNHN